jgi:hypothetical protein
LSPGATGAAASVQGPSTVVAVEDRVATAGTLDLTIAPNPFAGRSRIEYSMPVAGHVALGVYDLRGARVATLVDADVPAGRHASPWEGVLDGGAKAPAGVYFVRLAWRAAERQGESIRKVVLTR